MGYGAFLLLNCCFFEMCLHRTKGGVFGNFVFGELFLVDVKRG